LLFIIQTYLKEHDSILRIRIRIILQWAVTSQVFDFYLIQREGVYHVIQREGVHRSLIVCEILKIFNKNQIRNNSHFSLQEILMECMNKDAPSRNSSACFHVEFANFIQLFYELQLAGLFSHDLWVRGRNNF
jgi:hypothetical protein